ncbi:hypothetical protein [Agrobacterium genomosp. 2]|uniref:CBM-cenC domain-containing protein n=1 Tax=Agrobacterium genomosp. 2 str. CFBP 5494 TaxID=1183436 RepID=A0A9W5B334_9HYPH|nr:hypothetical protein [Agrobacterium genomosp. 2]CUW95119.1 conserved hypothetical protein [Agrobacterium genomosp. 2 str. CFBP 5494]
MPERSELYQIPSWPPTKIDRAFLNPILASIDDRLLAREALEASFEAMIAQGIQASLDYIQVNVAPQIANLQHSISLAQDQINEIIIGGSAPNALKFGNQLPAYYATAAALADGLAGKVPNARKVNGKELSADIVLAKSDIGLGNINNTADVDKPISTDQAAALAKRIRVDAIQNFSAAEKGRARANSGAGVLSGYRNKIINFNFDIWQRSNTQTSSGYGSDDRWNNQHIGTTKTHSRQNFALGQADVPGEPAHFSRTVVTSVAGAGNLCRKAHRIESVRTLAGKRATLTFYAKADAAKNIAVEMAQDFGGGGSFSPYNTFSVTTIAVTTQWTRYDVVMDIPSIAGKTLGTNGMDALALSIWFDAGSSYNARTNNLGQQSGTFDIARVSLVEGDASAEDDPAGPRHIQQELSLCQRYFCVIFNGLQSGGVGTNMAYYRFPVPMRATPSLTVANNGTSQSASLVSTFGAPSAVGGFFQINVTGASGYVDGWAGFYDAEI